MYASVRQYTMGAGSMADAMHIVDEKLADKFAEMPGFVAYEAIDCGDNQVCSLTIFQDEESAQRSADIAAEFVRENLAEFQIERTNAMNGEVMVSRATNDVLEAAHA
jgi:hypothetical protein